MTEKTSRNKISADGKAAGLFVNDIEPFLYGKPITYVDVGANKGSVYEMVVASSIRVWEAHLIEPNKKIFNELKETVDAIDNVNRVICHNIAVGSEKSKVTMRDEGTMTHVIDPSELEALKENQPSSIFEIDVTPLDELVNRHDIKNINLLKVDVEGYEIEAFKGAKHLLESEAIDIIYVEAGMSPDSTQQTYYRSIEDFLNKYGYRIFRVYEQKNEWLDDSPFLRRVNLAFMSSRFANNNPYKIMKELFAARKKSARLEKEKLELEKNHSSLDKKNKELAKKVEGMQEEEKKLKKQLEEMKNEDSPGNKRLKEEQKLTLEQLNKTQEDLEIYYLKVRELEKIIQEKNSKLQGISKNNKQIREDLKNAKDDIKRMRNSRSWKITAPLRRKT